MTATRERLAEIDRRLQELFHSLDNGAEQAQLAARRFVEHYTGDCAADPDALYTDPYDPITDTVFGVGLQNPAIRIEGQPAPDTADLMTLESWQAFEEIRLMLPRFASSKAALVDGGESIDELRKMLRLYLGLRGHPPPLNSAAAGEPLRVSLIDQCRAAAARHPFLFHAAATPYNKADPHWPETLDASDGVYLGIEPRCWREMCHKRSPVSLSVIDHHFIQFDGRLWQGAYYNGKPESGSADSDEGIKHNLEQGLREFRKLAPALVAAAAAHFGPIESAVEFPRTGDDSAGRWLERVYLLPFVATEEGPFPFLLKRLPGDVFSASAQALEWMEREQAKVQQAGGVHHGQRPAGDGGRSKGQAVQVKRPPEIALMVYRLRDVLGGTQTELAQRMTKEGHPMTQGEVSRYLGQVKAYLAAGNILPDLNPAPLRRKPRAIDPSRLELGPRGRGRQRGESADDSDSDD